MIRATLLLPLLPLLHSFILPPSLISRPLRGYLDDLTDDIKPTPQDKLADPERDSYEANLQPRDKVNNAGPTAYDQYVEFNEFDGGDGQMGVAGDGSKGDLEKIGDDTQQQVLKSTNQNVAEYKVSTKSRERSAKVAWGTSNGYADKLRDDGVETSRAQQFENWQNQNELNKSRKSQRQEVNEFSSSADTADEDWRKLSSFGVERVQDFDLEEAFGPVSANMDELEDTISIKSNIASVGFKSFGLKNQFMGFADFRAAFTSETSVNWTIEPTEGALKKSEETEFVIRYKPDQAGTSVGYLVIETEDFKKTFPVTGTTF
ncbi:hypothetical protein TeGR_g10312 [Tetraparma gracilis]|uniref:Uncharacterized protein n=1 Tax=Tetraparma gracilis TaxID=2962635 RepID=A0ABQ6MSB6_9STRA|nr:hypothetical protein TeGR_g10312 [Tetraparma gracilis]